MENENTDWTENIVMARELDADWFEKMADTILNRCAKTFTSVDKPFVCKYREALVNGVDEDGNHLNLIALNDKKPAEIVNDLRNINNHRSRATNIISQLEVEFFSPYDEIEMA